MAGVDEQSWLALETAGDANFGVVAAMAAGDGCALIEHTIQPERAYHMIEEHRATASPLGWILGKLSGTYGVRGHVKTRAAGTEPDIAPAIHAAMRSSAPAIVGGTSVTYAFEAAVPRSMRQLMHQGDGLDGTEPITKWVYGSWVEQLAFKQEENQYPVVEASGGFAHMGWCLGAPATDAAGYAASATQITLGAAHAFKVGPGAYVAFGASDNSGAGYLVTALSTDGQTITISPAIQAGEDIAAAITAIAAVVPGHTIGGTIQGGVEVVSTFDSVAIGVIKQNLTINTGIHGLDGESSTDRVNRIRRGDRTFEGEFEGYFLDENAGYFGRGLEGENVVPITLTYGANAAAGRIRLPMPTVRTYFNQITRDPKKESRIAGGFFPRMNAAAEDELTVVFD